MPEPPQVVTFGEIMAMFVAAEPGELSTVDRFDVRLAGAEMNVAVGLTRTGHRVGYLGKTGSDPLGTRARKALAAEGVDVSGLLVEPAAPTGFQLKDRVTGDDPTVVYFRSGSAGARYEWSEQAGTAIRSARHLHISGVFPALSATTRDCAFHAMATARAAGVSISFDPNLRPALWRDRTEMVSVINELAARADWVLPGIDEGSVLTGATDPEQVAAFYLDTGATHVVVKLGSAGAALCTRDGTWLEPAFPVQVVDTVGAGDGFAAGWISARLEGLQNRQALRRACALGAMATTSEGDMDGLPDRATLEAALSDAFPGRHANGAAYAATDSP